jgi:hypothetical protein
VTGSRNRSALRVLGLLMVVILRISTPFLVHPADGVPPPAWLIDHAGSSGISILHIENATFWADATSTTIDSNANSTSSTNLMASNNTAGTSSTMNSTIQRGATNSTSSKPSTLHANRVSMNSPTYSVPQLLTQMRARRFVERPERTPSTELLHSGDEENDVHCLLLTSADRLLEMTFEPSRDSPADSQ